MKLKHQLVPHHVRKQKIVLPSYVPLNDLISEGKTRETLANELSNSTKVFALDALSFSSNEKLDHIAVQLLYHIHTANSNPRYHSICKTNGSVNTFNRVNGVCEWITLSPNNIYGVIYTHAQNLLLLALQAGAEILESAFWTVSGTVVFYALDKNFAFIMYIQKATDEFMCKKVSDFKLDQLLECSHEHQADLNLLFKRIEDRVESLQSLLLEMNTPPKEALDKFLSFRQPICVIE